MTPLIVGLFMIITVDNYSGNMELKINGRALIYEYYMNVPEVIMALLVNSFEKYNIVSEMTLESFIKLFSNITFKSNIVSENYTFIKLFSTSLSIQFHIYVL